MGVKARGLAACLAAVAASVCADEPLRVPDLGPVNGTLGIPAQRSAQVTPQGTFALALHTGLASHYVSERRDGELLNLDGETLAIVLEARYAFAERWDVQFELPWLRHSGGVLDGVLDDWHDFIGSSDGGRSRVPRDVLVYGYRDGDAFFLDENASGVGDPRLSLNYAMYRGKRAAVALGFGYKFGVGVADEFLGSGADDAWLALRASSVPAAPLRCYGQLGYLRAGRGDIISQIQQRDLWFAGLGLEWGFAANWSVLAQLDAHAAPADSAITGLGDDTVMLSAGVRWRMTDTWSADFSMVEDIATETAPDVTLLASLRYRGLRSP